MSRTQAQFESTRTRRRSSSRRSQSSSNSQPESNGTARLVDQAIDIGIGLAVIVTPLLFAGRQPIGQLVLTCFACWTAICWAIRQLIAPRSIRWSGLEPLMVIGVGVITFQLVDLSPNLTSQLSPGLSELLPLWSTTNSELTPKSLQGGWSQLSLSPGETWSCLITVIAVSLIFWVCLQRLRTREDCFRMISLVAISVGVSAIFGVVQYATTNGKFFWIYVHPYTTTLLEAKGGFTNANHFAGFLALGAGPIAFVALKAMLGLGSNSSSQQNSFGGNPSEILAKVTGPVAWLLLCVAVIGAILSKSRGGIALVGVAAFVFGIVVLRKSLLPGKQIVVAIVGLVLVASGVVLFGDRILHENTEGMISGGLEELDEGSQRANVWLANWRMTQQFPYFGIGLGAHRDVIEAFTTTGSQKSVYSHAENSYINVMSETGFVGLAIAILILLISLSWLIRGLMASDRKDVSLGLAAIAAAFAVNMTHALYDFVWYVPGVMVSLAVLAACGFRLYQSATSEHHQNQTSSDTSEIQTFSPSRIPGVIRIAAMGGLAAWMISIQLPAAKAEPCWIDYLRLTFRPVDPDQTEDEARRINLQKLKLIAATVKRNPNHADAQLRLSRGYLQLFEMLQEKDENPLTIPQLRQTIETGGFESWEAIDEWLNLDGVIGKNRKVLDASLARAYKGLQLSPAKGIGYLYLAELGFVANQSNETRQHLLQQSLKVRPFLAQAHYLVGRDFWQQNNAEQGLKHWKKAFHLSNTYRDQITGLLAPTLSAQKMIELFEPGQHDLGAMRNFYTNEERPEDFENLTIAYAQACETASETENMPLRLANLQSAYYCYFDLNDARNSERIILAALKNNEFDVKWRRLYGVWLYHQQRYNEAKPHLAWCLQRQPDDAEVAEIAGKAVKAALESQTQIAQPDFKTGNSTQLQ